MTTTPTDRKYAASHEWLAADGKVGITDHAQEQLGDVVYVELPEVGREVQAGEAVAVVESVKAAADVYMPVSGEIVEINQALADEPSLANSDPMGAGWFFKVKLAKAARQNRYVSIDDTSC